MDEARMPPIRHSRESGNPGGMGPGAMCGPASPRYGRGRRSRHAANRRMTNRTRLQRRSPRLAHFSRRKGSACPAHLDRASRSRCQASVSSHRGAGGDPAQEIERGSAACRPRVAVGPGIQEYGYRLRPAIRRRSMERGHPPPVSHLDLRAGGDQGVHRCRLAP